MGEETSRAGVDSGGPVAGDFAQVGVSQTRITGDAEVARAQFKQFHAIHISNLLEPKFLAMVMRTCEVTSFGPGMDTYGNAEKTPGFREVELSPQPVGKLLNIALQRPAFLRWLEAVTGYPTLSTVVGRLTQILCRPGDELAWHDDYLEYGGRQLAIVINLGTEPYEGGEFAIRPKGGSIIFKHHYSEVGSALIFEVHPQLEHRVFPLTAGGPRRVFAGWAFREGSLIV